MESQPFQQPQPTSPNHDHKRFRKHESHDQNATSDELWSRWGLPGSGVHSAFVRLGSQLSTATRNKTADCVKVLLDVAKESSDWFPPLKSALGGVNALIKHDEVSVEQLAVAHN